MNADAVKSGTHSAVTSPNAPRSAHPPHVDDQNLTDASFLAREAELAGEAILRTFHDLKGDLVTAADLETWTRRHPWVAVGAAAAAGFVAAAAVVPSGRKDPPGEARRAPENGNDSGSSSWLSWLLTPVLNAARMSAEEFIQTAFHVEAPPVAGDGRRPAADHA